MYDLIAHYYDLSHADLTADLPLIHHLAEQAPGPLLEMGCGTGRLLLPLARAGHAITGVDNSAAMLSLARTKLAQENENVQKRITLLAADMTSFQTNGRYALAIIPYNTLLHLTPPQVNQTLTAARHHLLSSGQLFIDLANPFAIAQTPNDRMLTLERTFTDPRSGDIVLQLASNWLDEAQQRLHITWLYDATAPAGGAIHRTISQFDYYYLFPHQLEMALRQNGFQLEAMWGDYERTEFDEASERLLLLAHV